ncbi:hypothetical protein RvY_09815-1 [Ramazzottius varieornatus]|uniref:Uncharacterized protein n=1 Tax=Ramazzottius varieornatus TaxID=947166 RepID=A0A1D1VAN0_RAMVA|nr:hypothetical protein RvY_09815-1 [Ramazzottius varieornatus]
MVSGMRSFLILNLYSDVQLRIFNRPALACVKLLFLTVVLYCDCHTTLGPGKTSHSCVLFNYADNFTGVGFFFLVRPSRKTRFTEYPPLSVDDLDQAPKLSSNLTFILPYLKDSPTKTTSMLNDMDSTIPNRAGRVNGFDLADARYQEYAENQGASRKPFIVFRPKKILSSQKTQNLTLEEPSHPDNHVEVQPELAH